MILSQLMVVCTLRSLAHLASGVRHFNVLILRLVVGLLQSNICGGGGVSKNHHRRPSCKILAP